MGLYRSRTYDSLSERLVDAGIGALFGVPAGVLGFLATVWLVMH